MLLIDGGQSAWHGGYSASGPCELPVHVRSAVGIVGAGITAQLLFTDQQRVLDTPFIRSGLAPAKQACQGQF
ncbi:hypothetical protein PMM47T1_07791 [Pseudomonas sp. M47T1]|nr:hypothetical protein PMM47T1_07791 [Pseudomonas sp. M47T1]